MNIASFISGDESLLPRQKKLREIFLYIIFGGLTTLVNLLSFVLFDKIFSGFLLETAIAGQVFDFKVIINTTVSWIIAVLFAFFTNRMFVFRSHGSIQKEIIGFFMSRIVTLIVFEIGFLELGILLLEQGFGQNKDETAFILGEFSGTYLYIVKMLVAVFVVIANYILSRIFVFRAAAAKNAGKDHKDRIEESDKKVD